MTMEVSTNVGTPIAALFILENPNLKQDDLGVPFLETSICSMFMKQFSSPPGIQQVLGDCQGT